MADDKFKISQAVAGLNQDSITGQVKEGQLTYALNAQVESFDGNQVTYQNEQANIKCLNIPEGYLVIGVYTIVEDSKTILFLVDENNNSEIGFFIQGECNYNTLINAACLNFNKHYPIHDVRHKRNKCGTELYWTDNYNPRRWLDLSNLPYETTNSGCNKIITNIIDCNKLNIQPDINVPIIDFVETNSGGQLKTGTYQFAVQYANSRGDGYTSYYSVTNPISIFEDRITQDFNFETGKSITFEVKNLDTTGVYTHINIAVIKTINQISSVELIGTYEIREETRTFSYTGSEKTSIKLSENDIFERFPFYDKAGGLSRVDNVLVWYDLTTEKRNIFQKIANKINLKWISYRVPMEDGYKKAINTAELRGYMRDEVYPFEVQFIMKNGKETDGFHIPGREARPEDLEIILNPDTLPVSEDKCEEPVGRPAWQVYNTATNLGYVDNFCVDKSVNGAEITVVCFDENCTEQGEPQVHFKFNEPLAVDTVFHIGVLWDYGGPPFDPALRYQYVGSDIFVPPAGSVPNTYYDISPAKGHGVPFEIIVPAGSTTYSTTYVADNPKIFQIGITEATYTGFGGWVCDSCDSPIKYLYIKSAQGPQFQFSTPQNFEVFTIFRPEEEVPDEPCIEVDECYTGPWEYGEFGYWESEKTYPCNEEIWGELAGKPIRHHRFPDNLVSYHHDASNIFPLGLFLDLNELNDIIRNSDLTDEEKDSIVGFRILRGNRVNNKTVIAKGIFNNVGKYSKDFKDYYYPNYPFNDLRSDPFHSYIWTNDDSGANTSKRLDGFSTDDSKNRFTFHSPDTHFYQPTLGTHIKIDSIEYGNAEGHFIEVKDHSKYKFLSMGASGIAFGIGAAVAISRIMVGFSNQGPDLGAGLTAYSIAIEIFEKLIPKKSFAYQFNSKADYINYKLVPNQGNKIRLSDLMVYLTSGMQGVGDVNTINNFQRESSVYTRTTGKLLFPQEYGAPQDTSRYRMSEVGTCDGPKQIINANTSAYYGAIKRSLPSQYGDIYSYETISTGFQFELDTDHTYVTDSRVDIFGGDIFINKFSYKTKLPIFVDHRVGAPDGSDVEYNRLDNIAYPTFWYSTDFDQDGAPGGLLSFLKPLVGVKINNMDCKRNPVFYQDGKIYLFVYGIVSIYAESEVNVDYRQATNSREGDFYPHVGTGIPDDWFQEVNVSIVNDNTYTYNRTFSKQIKEHYVSHVPEDYTEDQCVDVFPNRAIYSDPQDSETKNNWLIYRPVSKKDFPYSYGPLKSIESLENRAILARFKNRSQIYNALLTAQTNSPLDVYLGNSQVFSNVPALDFADVNIGYNGTQHKLFLRTEYGHLTCDSERGKLFLIQGTKLQDLTQGLSAKFGEVLPFKINQYFPNVDIDNNFNGIGLTGTYDNIYKRLIITKLDYEPKVNNISYINNKFYIGDTEIQLSDSQYFCNKSWTASYSFTTGSWISFHSYIPRYYVESSGNFYTGIEGSIWEHNATVKKYNNFYGERYPYIIEYPVSFSVADQITQSVIDYTTSFKYEDEVSYYQNDDVYFNKSILSNHQQCSGVRNLVIRPKNNLKGYMSYPKYKSDSIDILVSKRDNKYQYNNVWNVVKSNTASIFVKSCNGIDKELNQDNMDYSSRSFNKQPLRAKELILRHILDDRDDHKLISRFLINESQISYT